MANYSLGEARGRITIDYDGSWVDRAKEGVSSFKSEMEATSRTASDTFKSLGGWKGIGDGVVDAGKKITLGLTAPALAAGAALGAMTLGPGLNRLVSIDNAQAKLKGLGHDAQSVQLIMDNALASVKGTAFGLGDAATVAANAVAAGVKPGQDLERTLKLTADAATIAGVGMGEMGAVFNKVAASNKVQMDVINQLHDAGVPALALLAQQMGVTAEEAAKMASDGKIDFETFQAAMEKGMGGAALESGKTFEGAMANMRAAMGRFGAELLQGILPMVQEAFGKIMEAFDKMKPLATQLASVITPAIGALLDGVIALATWFGNLSPQMQGAIMGAVAVAAAVGPSLMVIGKAFQAVGAAISVVQGIKAGYAAVTYGLVAANNAERVGMVANQAAYYAKAAALGVVTAAQKVAAAASVAWTEITKGAAVAAWLMQPANAAAAASLVAQKVALVATTVAQKAATAAQWLWNAALSANPIGLIIAAVAALVAAIIWFFTQTELGRKIWAEFSRFLGEAWANIQAAVGVVVDWFQTYVWPIIQFVIDLIVAYFQMYWTVVSTVWNAIMAVIGAVVQWFLTYVWPAIESVINFIAALFNFLWQVAVLAWQTMIDFIVQVVTTVVEWLVQQWNMFLLGWQIIWQAVSDFFTTIWNAIVAFITPIVNAISNVITSVFSAVWGFIQTVFGAIGSFIATVWNAISSVVSGVVNAVWGFISGVWGQIVSFVTTTFNNVKNAIMNPLKDALNFIMGIKDQIIGFFAGAGQWLLDAGASIIDGFVKGLEGALGGVKSFFDGLTNMIPQIKGPPAKDRVLLTENGRLIMQSLYNGLNSEMGDVLGLMSGLNATIPATLSQDVSQNVLVNAQQRQTGKPPVQIVINYNATPNDPIDERKLTEMLGHASELVREELG